MLWLLPQKGDAFAGGIKEHLIAVRYYCKVFSNWPQDAPRLFVPQVPAIESKCKRRRKVSCGLHQGTPFALEDFSSFL